MKWTQEGIKIKEKSFQIQNLKLEGTKNKK